ncbi:hypothetical protein VHEMI03647 [[Torrubiella] hemipterigena]|uniref:SH3 domain-containing protein n=1 Tax=[Torrubiella] hemipterigena TaxID=1531966 RepID=A0A0A1TBK2_9HYPO|nr:hypothetical protein VHEMI03647 [[Torrubiella] hemipterigena]
MVTLQRDQPASTLFTPSGRHAGLHRLATTSSLIRNVPENNLAVSMDEVSDLVVTPFRDIVEKANAAVGNAGDNAAMLKAAQALLKEGERALKRIEPQCKKMLDEYGANFHNALKDNNEIANFRTELTDLLWEFDDYIEESSFDAEKFTEVQMVSRRAAPKIFDILMRMKLEVPESKQRQFPSVIGQLSPPSSPLPGSVYPFPGGTSPNVLSTGTRSSTSSAQLNTARQEQLHQIEVANVQLTSIRDRQNSQEDALDPNQMPALAMKPPPMMPPPPPPTSNPWDRRVASIPEEDIDIGSLNLDRRAPVAPQRRSSPAQQLGSPGTRQPTSPLQTSPASGLNRGMRGSPHSPDDSRWPFPRPQSSGIPDERTPRSPSSSLQGRPSGNWIDGQGFQPPRPRLDSNPYPPEINYNNAEYTHTSPQVNEVLAYEEGDDEEQAYDQRRLSAESLLVDPTLRMQKPSSNPPIMPSQPIDTGLILVERDPVPVRTNRISKSCLIGTGSSFYLSKGFCEGAKEVVRGGIGVKKTKKPGFSATATVARCSSCLFELNFGDLENDINRLDKGNLSQQGLRYRLRFLQKCHVATRRSDDSLFACPFCVEQGHTLDEGDATVFFSVPALFRHISRHARPLPKVTGFSVVELQDIPGHLTNDYDLHLPLPAVSHPALDNADYSLSLPSGIAKDHVRRTVGLRLLPDRTPALEMVQGGRVARLSFPSKYGGEWCMGWHDGMHASIPFDCLRLELPPEDQIRIGTPSNIQAKARWAFTYKDKESKVKWLRFKKDEMITNITWSYPEHWCWSGTNSKGESGIFVQMFIDSNTVQELTNVGANRASSLSNERNKSSSILPRFSIRKTQGPPSIAGSMSSQETNGKTSISGLYFGKRPESRDV